MKPNLIAPCGMNCSICVAFLREKNKCPGCRTDNREYCRKCIVRNCKKIEKKGWKFCSPKCENFPCKRLKQLDLRYTTRYGMSMIDNLKKINEKGIREFIRNEKKRWAKGEKIFCVHNKKWY